MGIPRTRRLYNFGPFSLDATQRQLFKDNEVVALSPKVVDTLLLLVENGGLIVTKDEIAAKVWPDTFVADSSISQNISLLRRALGEEDDVQFIETVPKRGYRFVASVTFLNENGVTITEDAFLETSSSLEVVRGDDVVASHPQAITFFRFLIPHSRGARLTLVGLFLISLAAIAVVAGLKRREQRVASAEATVKSIAVLPFKTIGVGDNRDALGLGMADAIIYRLSKLRQPVVLPTATVYRYNDSERDTFAIGRDLSVDAVLEGTIQRSGDTLRVTAQLIRVSDQRTLWSSKFDEHYNSIFEAQDEISFRVAESLVPELTSGDKERLTKRVSQNPQAYDSYMMGLFLVSKSQESVIKSIPYFQQAIERDPNFGLAYASLADAYYYNALTKCYLAKKINFEVTSPKESLDKANQNVTKALEIDQNIAKAHLVRAGIKTLEKNYSGAQTEYQQALELDPNSAEAHTRYGSFLLYVGDARAAFEEKQKGQMLDPISLVGNIAAANAAIYARQYDEAIKYASRALEIEPTNATNRHPLGDAYLFKNDYGKAIDQFESIVKSNAPKYCIGVAKLKLAVAYARAGRKSEADELVRQSGQFRELNPEVLAFAYAALGDKEQALDLLQRIPLTRYAAAQLKFDPYLDPLRSDPRFVEILQKPILGDLI
jgi:DNA-binding winged helix-turn-helix (wHTH) protein/TolB-like protein/Tfp pilus assembly protein PilF